MNVLCSKSSGRKIVRKSCRLIVNKSVNNQLLRKGMGELGVVVVVGQALLMGGLTLIHWSASLAIPISCALKQELMQSPQTSKVR